MTKAELKQLDKIEFTRYIKRRCQELVDYYEILNKRKRTGWKNPGKVRDGGISK